MPLPADSIILIRHAQPADQHVTAPNHWIDMGLTDLGRRQAEAAAERLAHELSGAPGRLYSSDLRRASQTAEPIARRLGVPVRFAPELREFNNGLADGLTEEDLRSWAAEITPPMRAILAEPQGESWAQFHQRVAGFMQRVAEQPGRPILVVAHYGAIGNILSWWLRPALIHPEDPQASFNTTLASVSVLTVSRQGKPTVERLNDTAHLAAAGLE